MNDTLILSSTSMKMLVSLKILPTGSVFLDIWTFKRSLILRIRVLPCHVHSEKARGMKRHALVGPKPIVKFLKAESPFAEI
jgi:hypothetical protein